MKHPQLKTVVLLFLIYSLVFIGQAFAIHPGMQPDGFTEIIDSNKPAIVYIQVKSKASSKDSSAHNKILKDIFGDSPGKDNSEPFFSNDTSYSFGSGFIINRDGYILTNYHVIKNATEVTVTTADKQKFDATIIGTDPKTDIGLIKIKRRKPPDHPTWRLRFHKNRTMGSGLWSPLRVHPVRNCRYYKRHRKACPRHQRLRGLYPDRCGHQSRQLRRATGQHQRRGDRNQHGLSHTNRRLYGNRFRHPD